MENNNVQQSVHDKDVLIIVRAQTRLLRVYRRLGTWRAVGEKLGINQRYVWELCKKSIVPDKLELRKKLGLPAVLPSERVVKIKIPIPLLGSEGWESVFFKQPKPHAKQCQCKSRDH